ncbi:phage head closure protein [Neorhizobium sp. DAR64860/K0K1]|uniref:phage head closure protein n=1 Tax=Neorhizobium sp. DAR64860/K0K1 TaxID=3421955 RepID=UPI003D2E47FA
MRAGKLDRTITIERFSSTPDDFGTPVETWTPVATLRAQVIQSATEEFLSAQGATDATVIVFRTRWLDGIMTSDQLGYEAKSFNIREVKEIGRRRGLEIRCEAKK